MNFFSSTTVWKSFLACSAWLGLALCVNVFANDPTETDPNDPVDGPGGAVVCISYAESKNCPGHNSNNPCEKVPPTGSGTPTDPFVCGRVHVKVQLGLFDKVTVNHDIGQKATIDANEVSFVKFYECKVVSIDPMNPKCGQGREKIEDELTQYPYKTEPCIEPPHVQ